MALDILEECIVPWRCSNSETPKANSPEKERTTMPTTDAVLQQVLAQTGQARAKRAERIYFEVLTVPQELI